MKLTAESVLRTLCLFFGLLTMILCCCDNFSTVLRSILPLRLLVLSAMKLCHEAMHVGRGPATRYKLTPQAHVTMPLDLATYFDKDIDEREVQESFNFDLIRHVLPKVDIFTKEEMERLGIDLSWKSSQIEGNTYSLLETERLLKDKQTASGKTKEEAIMLLNHKKRLSFVPICLHLVCIYLEFKSTGYFLNYASV